MKYVKCVLHKNNSKNNLKTHTHKIYILMYSILDKPTMDFLTRDNCIIHCIKKIKNMSLNDIIYYNNFACLSISLLVSCNIYLYYYVNKSHLNDSLPVLLVYFFFDNFINKTDLKLHHFLIFCLMLFNYYNNVSINDSYIPIVALYKTEISTIFLSIENMIQPFNHNKIIKNYISPINKLLFLITFIKFRICDLYNNVIINPAFYYHMEKYTTTFFNKMFLYIPIYSFYALNLYWILIICKISVKPLIKKFNSDKLLQINEYFTQYTLFCNIPIAVYIYSLLPNQYNIINMTGITLLSINSYIYHNKIYSYLCENKQINYLDSDITITLLNDNISIHINSIFYVLTNILVTNDSYMYIFYISLAMHLNSLYKYIIYINKIRDGSNKIFYNNENSSDFTLHTNLYTIFHVSIDILYSIYNTNNLITKINLSIVSLMLFFIVKINPLYELNHLLFHFVVIIQQIFLCYSVISYHNSDNKYLL